MINRFFRLIGRAYASLSVDFLAYVIVPASLVLTGAALYPEEFEKRLLSVSEQTNVRLATSDECGGKLGMENGDVKIAFVKFERTYWDSRCGALSISRSLMELGLQYDDRPIQAVSLLTAFKLLPEMKQAAADISRVFRGITAEEMSTIKNGKCQWRIKRGREDLTFGLVCPRSFSRL